LIRQMLAKRPSDRPASMKEVLLQVGAMRFLNRVVG
jgi:hypothetical protein